VINIRNANIEDINTYFKWANEESVRKFSFNSEKIPYSEHQKWFNNCLIDKNCFMYLFFTTTEIGQVRIQKIKKNEAIISISIDEQFRGKGYGVHMLNMSIESFRKLHPETVISAYIKIENIASKNIFEKSGFKFKEELVYKNAKSYHHIKV
jgi:RimJ/RimL family protein N-acetyltransferase